MAQARRFVRDTLMGWGAADAVDDAVLLTSELATNAIAHAETPFEVICRAGDSSVQVEVVDHDPAGVLPAPGHGADPDCVSGRGLLMPVMLASAWGVSYGVEAKTVWFRLATGARPAALVVAAPDSAAGHAVSGEATDDAAAGGAAEPVAAPAPARCDATGGDPAPRDAVARRPAACEPGTPAPAVCGGGPGTPVPAVRGDDAGTPMRAVRRDDAGAPLPAVTRTVAGAHAGVVAAAAEQTVTPACADRVHQGWLSFLAEASTLLAGTLDESMLLALAAQLVVPRLARWCAFFRADDAGGAELTHVWHADERRIDALRELLATAPPPSPADTGVGPWAGLDGLPADRLGQVEAGAAVVVPLRARWRSLGILVLGQAEKGAFPHENLWLVEDLGARIAVGLDNARMYCRQRAASRALQHSLLPYDVPEIPGIEHSVVYRPGGEGYEVGGDFYDVFQTGPDHWRFAIGDVCGTGPQAAAVTGLARHALRLLAGEGHGVAAVVTRLNQAILAEGGRGRLMTLLHGELRRRGDAGVRLTLVSAGHPLPLRLTPSGLVSPAARAQLLLGAVDDARFEEDTVDLGPGDVLLCVTDGVTERRATSGRLLDDDDGLARLLAGWAGLTAGAVAERLRQTVEAFAPEPGSDDLAILVLRVLQEGAGRAPARPAASRATRVSRGPSRTPARRAGRGRGRAA